LQKKAEKEKRTPGMGREPDRTYDDDELMNGILSGDLDIFRYLLGNSLPYLLKSMGNGGTRHLAEEIVRDAYIVVFRKLSSGKLLLKCRFHTYFMAVCRNILKYNHKLRGNYIVYQEIIPAEAEADEQEIALLWRESREFRLYRRHFSKLKQKQQNILASSLDGVPYQELYRQFGFRSLDAFKNEVSRIRKKLFCTINSDPEFTLLKNRNFWNYEE
jgi:DNA-directed RNA polymerase specialized sigma24 family protein